MKYTRYIAAVGALLARLFKNRRRKVREPRNLIYCTWALPPGGDPDKDMIQFIHIKRPD